MSRNRSASTPRQEAIEASSPDRDVPGAFDSLPPSDPGNCGHDWICVRPSTHSQASFRIDAQVLESLFSEPDSPAGSVRESEPARAPRSTAPAPGSTAVVSGGVDAAIRLLWIFAQCGLVAALAMP